MRTPMNRVVRDHLLERIYNALSEFCIDGIEGSQIEDWPGYTEKDLADLKKLCNVNTVPEKLFNKIVNTLRVDARAKQPTVTKLEDGSIVIAQEEYLGPTPEEQVQLDKEESKAEQFVRALAAHDEVEEQIQLEIENDGKEED